MSDSYIVDSSAVATRLLEDEVLRPEYATIFEKAVSGEVELCAPGLLVYEIGNVLRSSVLSKRYTKDEATRIFELFFDLPLTFIEPDFEEVMELCLSKNLTFYDASYVHLSKKTGYRLLTLDKRLLKLEL